MDHHGDDGQDADPLCGGWAPDHWKGERKMSKVAYHEAGHAVAGVLTGRKITRVWLKKGPRELGLQLPPLLGACELDPPVSQDHISALLAHDPDALEKYVIVLLAGFVAEALFCYGTEVGMGGMVFPREVIRACGISDRLFGQDQAKRMAKLISTGKIPEHWKGREGEASYLYFRSLMNDTANLLTEPAHWRAVQALARALRQRNSIEGREVHGIIARAMKDKRKKAVRIGGPLMPTHSTSIPHGNVTLLPGS